MGNGGQASECGWCIDRWGLRWQIIPRVLTHAIAAGGEAAQHAFVAMMTMQKRSTSRPLRRLWRGGEHLRRLDASWWMIRFLHQTAVA